MSQQEENQDNKENSTEEKSNASKDVSQKKTSSSKKSSLKSKKSSKKESSKNKMTISQFAGQVGLNSRLRVWADKMYSGQKKTARQWYEELKSKGAMEKLPNILK